MSYDRNRSCLPSPHSLVLSAPRLGIRTRRIHPRHAPSHFLSGILPSFQHSLTEPDAVRWRCHCGLWMPLSRWFLGRPCLGMRTHPAAVLIDSNNRRMLCDRFKRPLNISCNDIAHLVRYPNRGDMSPPTSRPLLISYARVRHDSNFSLGRISGFLHPSCDSMCLLDRHSRTIWRYLQSSLEHHLGRAVEATSPSYTSKHSTTALCLLFNCPSSHYTT